MAVVPDRTPPGLPGEVLSKAVGADRYPVGALPALRAAGEQRIFNLYRTGGMLDWALYPQRRVFVDGRADLHSGGQTLEQYLQVTRLEPGWEQVLDAHAIDLVLLDRDHPVLSFLEEKRGWQVLYEDEVFRLLQR